MDAFLNFIGQYHPFFAHFPVALISIGAIVRIYWAVRPNESNWHGSQWMMGLGAISSFFTIFSGLSRVHFHFDLHGNLAWHRNFAVGLGIWSVLQLVLMVFRPKWSQEKVFLALWAFVGLALALTTGYFGGEVAEGV